MKKRNLLATFAVVFFPCLFAAFLATGTAVAAADAIAAENSAPAAPTTLAERLRQADPKPEKFFSAPVSDEDKTFFQAGLLHHWQMYQKTAVPDASAFKGYIIFGDPYHRGLKRISFLLGTDCSNFVHRLYQMLGAEFRFMKTRHWIHLARALKQGPKKDYYREQNAGNTPIDLSRCDWNRLLARFRAVEPKEAKEVGDIVVYPKAEGILGEKGHMGFISRFDARGEPVVLQSKYPVGIVELPVEKDGERFFLRYVGGLAPIPTTDLATLLKANYPEFTGEPAGKEACGK